MHIYFIGIGGTGIGPLALIASQAGYDVSGSDKLASQYTAYLEKKGLSVFIDQSGESMAKAHEQKTIDWVVSVSAIVRLQPDHPELVMARQLGIRVSERDDLLNTIVDEKGLKMIAAAGTHGKTTTTAMLMWLFLKLDIPLSYSVGAKTSFADMGHFDTSSQYFVYECDEFHRNFLKYHPHLSVITGIAWDHHEVFPTREDYRQAFRDFIGQSQSTIIWQTDYKDVSLLPSEKYSILPDIDPKSQGVTLPGLYNRRDAWLAVQALHDLTAQPIEKLVDIINSFPGSSRRMESLAPNLYSDYAHTPEKIRACLDVANDIRTPGQKLIIVYEPLTDRRQHHVKELYKDIFMDVDKLYWMPSYLAREDPDVKVLTPQELIDHLSNPEVAEAAELDDKLRGRIRQHLSSGDLVVAISGGGGNSLDEWARQNFAVE